jgi:hypothetical protein
MSGRAEEWEKKGHSQHSGATAAPTIPIMFFRPLSRLNLSLISRLTGYSALAKMRRDLAHRPSPATPDSPHWMT